MTNSPADDDFDDLSFEQDPDAVLHSFAVMARFRCEAASEAEAEAAVRRQLAVVRDLYDDARVEPQEPDGRWAVDVRFVVASVDGEMAVTGVDSTLREQGLVPTETWVTEKLP